MTRRAITIHPRSLDEIEQTFVHWLRPGPGRRGVSVHFSRPSRSRNRLVMRSRRIRDIRLQLKNDALSGELYGQKFQLLLDHFDVQTEIDDGEVLFKFSPRENSFRPLREKLHAVEDTKNPVFIARALNALTGLEQSLPKERIEQASAAATDYMVLVEALSAPSVATQLAAQDPLAAAKLRGADRQRILLEKSGGVLRSEEVADLLGISRQAVDKRRRQGQLIGLTQGRRGYAYPAWQFEGPRTLANLEKVVQTLRVHDPWMQLAFFVNPNDRLNGCSPLEMLRAGKLEPVLQAAESYVEQGAA